MGLAIHLLGRPRLERPDGESYQFRSRKSWALLTYLILNERRATRSQLAALLFAEADDPARALRWSLAEIRRGLGEGADIAGDPVDLRLPAGTVVDAVVVQRGSVGDAVALPGLGAELLDGMAVRGAAGFDAWLLSEQRHMAAATEAILHEAALRAMSRGELQAAATLAVRAVTISPLDEANQALVIRLYRLAGEVDAAERQYAACVELFDRELGIAPGPLVRGARREAPQPDTALSDDATIEALVETGRAAVSAGAVEAGIQSLRTATRLADQAGATRLRLTSRLTLAETYIHSLGGLDEEGLAALYEADEIAVAHGLRDVVSQVRAELGYVDFLRGRYDRAEVWLTDAFGYSDESPELMAKASTYLGSVESDRGNYRSASRLLDEAITQSRAAGNLRREAFARSMSGRVSLFHHDLDAAAAQLDAAVELAERDHWLSFLPWPQAMRGEVQLRRGDSAGAATILHQAFARACRLGDPCWEGMSARGLALLAAHTGDPGRAFAILDDARTRCNRLADPYVWLDAYILDAQCSLGRAHGHPDAPRWVAALRMVASKAGMKELTVRSMVHGAALGAPGDAEAAALLATDVDNPALDALVAGVA